MLHASLHPTESFHRLAAEWDAFVTLSSWPSVFVSYDFMHNWLACYGTDHHRILVLRDENGQLRAACPIEVQNIKKGMLDFYQVTLGTSPMIPRNDVPITGDLEEILSHILRTIFAQLPGFRFRIENVLCTSKLARLTEPPSVRNRFRIIREPARRSPYIDVDQPVDNLRSTFSASTREMFRRSRNKAERAGRISAVCHDEPKTLESVMHIAAGISERSWKKGKGTHLTGTTSSAELYRRMASNRLGFAAVKIWLLSIGEVPVAMQIHGINDGIAYLFRSDFDETYSAYSVGNVLTDLIIETYCADSETKEFDLCGQDYDYKRKIATGTREHVHLEFYAPTLTGRSVYLTKLLQGSN